MIVFTGALLRHSSQHGALVVDDRDDVSFATCLRALVFFSTP